MYVYKCKSKCVYMCICLVCMLCRDSTSFEIVAGIMHVCM